MPPRPARKSCRAGPVKPAASAWVTVLTADARPEQRKRGFAIGANDYLVKPVSLGELAASLHRYLESRSLRSDDRASPEAA